MGEGLRFFRLNRDGELEQTVTIDMRYIDFVPNESILLIDSDFLVPIQMFEIGGSDRYYIVNLSKGGELTEIPLETLYPDPLLENFSTVVYDSIFYPPDPSQSTAFFWYEEGYADVLFTSAALIWRWYYKIESYTPLKLSGPLTTYHRHGDRANLYLSKTGDYLFVGGSMKSRLEDGSSFQGHEISVHPAEGGDELVVFRLWNSNDRYVKRNGETWFAKDIWSWDYLTEKWDFIGETEAYILDEINLELYRVGVNGDVVLVPPFYDNR